MQVKTCVLCVMSLLTGKNSIYATLSYSFQTQIKTAGTKKDEESNNIMKAHDAQNEIGVAKANDSNDVEPSDGELGLAELTLDNQTLEG